MENMMDMDYKLREVAGRIRELRQISGLTVEEMAQRTDVSVEEYTACEAGSRNMSIAFLYRCVLIFGVDFSDLLEGRSPKLRSYALTRKGEGQRIEEAHHMIGYNLAADFRNRIALPLYMELNYRPGAENEPIELVSHVGGQLDIFILRTGTIFQLHIQGQCDTVAEIRSQVEAYHMVRFLDPLTLTLPGQGIGPQLGAATFQQVTHIHAKA